MLWPLYFGNLSHPQNQPGHLPPPEIEPPIPFIILTEISQLGHILGRSERHAGFWCGKPEEPRRLRRRWENI
jgi:hypothetical protein